MKILISCMAFQGYTGSELYNYTLSRELSMLGHDITIVSHLGTGKLAKRVKKAGVNCIDFTNFLPDKKFDVLLLSHTQTTQAILRYIPNVPAINIIHSEVLPTFESPVIDERIKKYICIRQAIQQQIIREFNIPIEKTKVIHNPINYHKFNKHNLTNPHKRTALFVGTLDYLREKVVLKLIDDSIKENFNVIIVGAINKNFLNYPLPKNVKYYTPVWDIERFYKQATETWGILLGRTSVEGMACNLPAHIFNVDEHGTILSREVIEPNQQILDKFDSKLVAKQIEKVLEEIIKNEN